MSAQVMTLPYGAATVGDTTLPAAMQRARRVGKYTLTDTLGEGAMGVVYRALDPSIDRVVAVKTIRKTLLDTPTGNQSAALRFRNEARAAGRLSHPGIVSIYEYGEDGEQSFIAMELVEGASLLRCTVPQQRLPLADVLSVASQLLNALNYAHAHGVWHRDIKPSNLIVTAGGQLKITDFGIARIDATALTQDATIMGSFGYMAPECYQGVELDQRVDLFACGVLLYELLTGRRPFTGIPGAVMHQLLNCDSPPLVGAGCGATEAAALAPFETIVARAMARDRAQRYPGAQEMLDALTAAAAQPIAPRVSVAAAQRLVAPRAVAVAAQPALRAPKVGQDPARVRMLPRKSQPIYMRGPAQAAPAPAAAPAAAPAPVATPAPATAAAVQQQAVPPPREAIPGPTASPASRAFDPASLAALEALLVQTLGPVARIVVQRAAAATPCLATLVARIAEELPQVDQRRHFLAQAQRTLGASAGTGITHQPRSVPVPGSTPLSDKAVQYAERVLTYRIGPIARVMVKAARSKAEGREQFMALLADLAAGCTDPERLRAELEQGM